MPSTVNGIGTHYHGKDNLQRARGVCQRCGFEGDLTSYDTRLWFTVFYIPVIPLGRKRIINHCPRCTYHFSLPIDQWEAQRQLSVSGAEDAWRTKATPEAAIDLHETLLGFQHTQRAASVREELKTKFQKHARVHEYLGGAFHRLGDPKLGDEHFRTAHELRPDLPEARIGMARKHMRENRLDDARALLDFLEKPGAAQLYNLGSLEDLADGYQHENRHSHALEIYRHLLAEVPSVGQHAGFRNKVAASEKALKATETLLPKAPGFSVRLAGGWWRKFSKVAALIGVVVAGFAISNEWIRRNQILWIVNGFERPLTVTIAGGSPVEVEPGRSAKVRVSEGDFSVQVSGATTRSIDVSLHADYFSRWGDDTAWVVNPQGAAAIVETTATYSTSGQTPSHVQVHYGREFMSIEDVNYAFRSLPDKISMKKREGDRLVKGIEVYDSGSVEMFQYLRSKRSLDDALKYAQVTLMARPNDGELLDAYAYTAAETKAPGFEEMLKAGLGYRPVSIVWHRHYQNTKRNTGDRERLRAEYDAAIGIEPRSAELLYLRGRLGETPAECRAFFDRALAIDPKLGWALFAVGFDAMARGAFEEARKPIDAAFRTNPREKAFRQARNSLRICLGEIAAYEADLRKGIGREQRDWRSVRELSNILASTGRLDEAMKVIAQYERHADSSERKQAAEAARALEREAAYVAGDLSALEARVMSTPGARDTPVGVLLFLASGRIDEASRLPYFQQLLAKDWHMHLLVSLAAEVAGDTNNADHYRSLAIQLMSKDGPDEARASRILESGENPTARLDDVILVAHQKAALCAALGRKFPEKRAAYFAMAKKLNLTNDLIVNRAIKTP